MAPPLEAASAPAAGPGLFGRLRWRRASRPEALAAEARLLALAGAPLAAADVRVGPGKEDFLHAVSGGAANAASPSLVYVPGYGAGAGEFSAVQLLP
jgi:abhydrolase domain-containing protein 5